MELEQQSDSVIDFLEGKVDFECLQLQLRMLPDAIKTAFDGSIKKVTNVRTIVDAFANNKAIRQMLGEVHTLLRVYLTVPVTSANAERAFSSLRRIKTFLRSSMSSQRLNNLFILHVHQQLIEALDLKTIAKEFISANNRRLNFFGHF